MPEALTKIKNDVSSTKRISKELLRVTSIVGLHRVKNRKINMAQKSNSEKAEAIPIQAGLGSNLDNATQTKVKPPERFRSVVWLILISLLLFLSFQGTFSPYFDKTENNAITMANEQYLKTAEVEAFKTYLLLAEFGSGLSMLQSSRAGVHLLVDFEVQVGGELTQISSLVDRATQASMLAMTMNFVIQVLLKFCEWISPFVFMQLLVVAFFYFLVCVIIKRNAKLSRILAVLTSFSLSLFLVMHLLFPLAIYGSSLASKELTNSIGINSYEGFSAAHNQMLGNEKSKGVVNRVKAMVHRYEKALVNIAHKIENMSKHAVRHFVVVILDVFVFPLVFLWLLMMCCQKMIVHIFDIARPFMSIET